MFYRKNISRALVLSYVLLFGFSAFIPQASAHVTTSNNGISAVLHIEPDDFPLPGKPAILHLIFEDEQNKFDATHCDCTITILQDEKAIATKKSSDSDVEISKTFLAIPFTFPSAAGYDVSIEGKPQDGYSFNSFALNFDVDVANEGDESATSTETATTSESDHQHDEHADHAAHSLFGIQGHLIHIFLFGGAILFCIVVIIRDKGDENTHDKK